MENIADVNVRMLNDIDKRKTLNAFRELKIIKNKIDFSSNDYLGFAQNDTLKNNIISELQKLQRLGAGGARLLSGNNLLIERLEKDIAKFHDAEGALFFNSGYEANAGLIATVVKRNDCIIYDELIHASLREGIRLTHAHAFSFGHNNMEQLENKLKDNTGEKFIIIESIYSMDGDSCPLQHIVSIAEKYHAHIILDEAHATGIIGEKGEGLAQQLNLQKKIFARVHTFGKAIGFNGAAILGSDILKNYLINYCRPFIYTTAPNLMQVVAVSEAYNYLHISNEIIQRLKHNCQYFKQACGRIENLHLLPSHSAIFSIVIPGNEQVKKAAAYLQDCGYDIRPIVSPTVAEGAERLRICIHSFNSEAEIDALIKLLQDVKNNFVD